MISLLQKNYFTSHENEMEIEELQETVNLAPAGRVEKELAEGEVADFSLSHLVSLLSTSSLFALS